MLSIFIRYKAVIEKALSDHFDYFGSASLLKEAIIYALQNGGKRFRPAIVCMVAEALVRGRDVTKAALAIEFFHSASLIADDLPCMDNDDLRRSQPSLHKAYGEATALLASYALISAGYDFIRLAAEEQNRADLGLLAVENVSVNTGINGAVGGQHADLFAKEFTQQSFLTMVDQKTGTLFEISFVFGWLFGGGEVELLNDVKSAARSFGRAFQIFDDLEDIEQDTKGVNFAKLFGKEQALAMLSSELAHYNELLKKLKIASPELVQLGQAITYRK